MTAIAFPTSFAEFEAFAAPGAVLDLDGKMVAVNAAGTRLLARPRDEILGRRVSDFAPGMEYLWAERVAAARAPGGTTFDIAIATPDGAQSIEYVVAVCELDGQLCVVAFATGVRPLG